MLKNDKTVDSWNWILSKTYVVSAESRGGPYKEGNMTTHFQIVKRIYKWKEATDLKKTIVMLCAPGRNSTGKFSFDEAVKHAVISYSFENWQRMIPPSPKSRIYPSGCQELKHKIEQGKPQKKATHEVLKRRGGIGNVPSGSHVLMVHVNHTKYLVS